MARSFERVPLLVFWEITRACPLVCIHCRADAVRAPLPGQLTSAEGLDLLDSLLLFGDPKPIIVLTGGDILSRPDLFLLLEHAAERDLRITLSPAVTPALTDRVLRRFADLGIATISLSLDGDGPVHDRIRGVPGHAERTRAAIDAAHRAGLRVQVNTCVMRENILELPPLVARLVEHGVESWEVFFLVQTGRGTGVGDLSPEDCEATAHFLYDVAQRGLTVRVIEAPFFRRITSERVAGRPPPVLPLYRQLMAGLPPRKGERVPPSAPRSAGTRDGNGIVFIAHDGTVQPGGFVPIAAGNVRTDSVVDIYRHHPLFRLLRDADLFGGRCGACEYRRICGGSRARAYAAFGDPLHEDPACCYVPALTFPAAARAPSGEAGIS